MNAIPKKSFGQHFLRDEHVIDRIVKLVNAKPGDTMVEIGPGEGVLTKELFATGATLILVEADRDLVSDLEANFPNTKIVSADAAQVDYSMLVDGAWTLVGNLPYNASAAIIVNAIESPKPPKRMVVMVQAEQADRISAKVGETGVLSIAIQLAYEVKKAFDVSPDAFVPRPRVDSTVLELTRRASSPNLDEYKRIMAVAKAGFSSRRKQLHKNLDQAGIATSEAVKSALVELKLSERARAQELSIDQWVKLTQRIS